MRRAAARGRADSCQPECIRAIQLLGLQYKDLSAAGDGIEDLVVLMPPWHEDVGTLSFPHPSYWLFVECKVPRNKSGTITTSQYKKAQLEWRAKTPLGPRITVTGFQDCLDQLRARMG